MGDNWNGQNPQQQQQQQQQGQGRGGSGPRFNPTARPFVPSAQAPVFVPNFGGGMPPQPQQFHGPPPGYYPPQQHHFQQGPPAGMAPQHFPQQHQQQPMHPRPMGVAPPFNPQERQALYQHMQHQFLPQNQQAFAQPQQQYQQPRPHPQQQQQAQVQRTPQQPQQQPQQQPPTQQVQAKPAQSQASQAAAVQNAAESWDDAESSSTTANGTSNSVDSAASQVQRMQLDDTKEAKTQSQNGPTTSTDSADNKSEQADDAGSATQSAADEKYEEEDDNDEEEEIKFDSREHLNIVFIGHVDAGKSTIAGNILVLTGQVDERTVAKYERDAREKNRDSWYLAYVMDTNDEERAKGKTVEVGRANFDMPNKRYTVLDAPGHKSFVSNMIVGASQADVGVLVISARKGEFETGFERGGQTREHSLLAKTLGVKQLVVVINKMDEQTVNWSQERYDECVTKLTPFLKQIGYNPKKDLHFLPVSGLTGANLLEKVSSEVCSWYQGDSLLNILDSLSVEVRDPTASVRIPVLDKYRDMGVLAVLGKVEQGTVRQGRRYLMMPAGIKIYVEKVEIEEVEANGARPGENVKLQVRGIEEENIRSGFVVCSVQRPVPAVTEFDAQLVVLDLLSHKPIISAGYECVLHVHTIIEECCVIQLFNEINRKTNQKSKRPPQFVKSNQMVTCRIQVPQMVCVERFADCQQLGRFTLRDEGRTIAIGKILGFPSQAQ